LNFWVIDQDVASASVRCGALRHAWTVWCDLREDEIMKLAQTIMVLGVASVALTANNALAEKCNGYAMTKSMKPILMRETPDGAKVKWYTSEGIFFVANPQNHPANGVNRICAGGLQIAPDGKSGSGTGSCTYADMDGDVYHLIWNSTFGKGTWKIVGGTGKFEKFTGNGTYKLAKRYQNSLGTSTWEGECNLAK